MKTLDERIRTAKPEHRVIVLRSVAEMPNPPLSTALERRCEACGCPVWVAPATIQFLISRMGERWRLMCNACADPIVKSDANPTFLTSGSLDSLDVIELPNFLR